MNFKKYLYFKDGKLFWLPRDESEFVSHKGFKIWNARYPYKEAGNFYHPKYGRTSYRSVSIKGKRFYAHRIVWELHFGEIPEGMVLDHIDADGLNNNPSNLRLCSSHENSKNRRMQKNNNTGINGVCKQAGQYRVRFTYKRKVIFFKRYKDFFEACCARRSIENRLGYDENHGRKREAKSNA